MSLGNLYTERCGKVGITTPDFRYYWEKSRELSQVPSKHHHKKLYALQQSCEKLHYLISTHQFEIDESYMCSNGV